jgi:hypothetical protein
MILFLFFAQLLVGGQQWEIIDAGGQPLYTIFDVVHACCTPDLDRSQNCSVRGRLTCTQLFALPDIQLPSGCEHRWEHIVCNRSE